MSPLKDAPPPTDGVKEVLRASVPDVRPLASILRGIQFSNANQRATMSINESGLQIHVEEARTLLGAAWIKRDLFDEFAFSTGDSGEDGPTDTVFSFQLNTLLECLNVFGTASGSAAGAGAGARQPWRRTEDDTDHDSRPRNSTNGALDAYFPRMDGKGTGMKMTYVGEGHPLVLLLAEGSNGPTTSCDLVTYDPEEQLDLPFDSGSIVLKCILKSSWLRDALSEIDSSCERITFMGNPSLLSSTTRSGPSRSLFRIKAVGPFGSTEMEYPNDPEVLYTFECAESAAFTYRLAHILRALRALQNSQKASLRIDAEGILSLQFLIVSPSPRTGAQVDSIIDFRCPSVDGPT